MIRTRIVELSTIDGIAYRRKLKGAQTAIVIQRYEGGQAGLATLNRNTGEADPAANMSPDLFPAEAFDEAVELTHGLPYTARGRVVVSAPAPATEVEADEDAAEVATVCSKDYSAILSAYTDKRGRFSYDLMNKDFIQFAKSSRVVSDLVGKKSAVEEIRAHVLRAKLEHLTGNRDLSDAEIHAIVDMLDEINPRQVFADLNKELRRMLAR